MMLPIDRKLLTCLLLTLTVASSRTRQTEASSSSCGGSPPITTRLFLPQDIYMDSTTRLALESLRERSMETPLFVETLGTDQRDYATLTLVGNKGGGLQEQINQDRSFVLTTTTLVADNNNKDSYNKNNNAVVVVSGVLDGHGGAGHLAAEHARHSLLQKFRTITEFSSSSSSSSTPALLEKWLKQAFVEADTAMPEDIANQGGATCSIVVQYNGTFVSFANAGDSQSFLVAVILEQQQPQRQQQSDAINSNHKVLHTRVVYETRLDTPKDPKERERLTKAGATVTQERDDEVRVWSKTEKGEWFGLAMSRVLGDRNAEAVIAEPIVHTIDIAEVKQQVIDSYQAECELNSEGESTCTEDTTVTTDQVHLFCVSATDGVMDYLKPQQIAEHLAPLLYDESNIHPLLGLEDLMHQSATIWHKDMQGQYRDDMAMAVAKVQ